MFSKMFSQSFKISGHAGKIVLIVFIIFGILFSIRPIFIEKHIHQWEKELFTKRLAERQAEVKPKLETGMSDGSLDGLTLEEKEATIRGWEKELFTKRLAERQAEVKSKLETGMSDGSLDGLTLEEKEATIRGWEKELFTKRLAERQAELDSERSPFVGDSDSSLFEKVWFRYLFPS